MHRPRDFVTAAVTIAVYCVLAAPARGATLSGTIRAGQGLNNPEPLAITLDAWVCGQEGRTPDPRLRIDSGGGIADVVVTVADAPDPPAYETAAEAELYQKGCVFAPHVLVVAPGQEIRVHNNDGVFHNVRSIAGENRPLNRGQPGGAVVRMKFPQPENVRLGCDVHYWMSAVVVVAPHAFTAVSNESGDFGIEGMHPGRYRLALWHETLGIREAVVTVTDKGGSLDFTWPAPSMAK